MKRFFSVIIAMLFVVSLFYGVVPTTASAADYNVTVSGDSASVTVTGGVTANTPAAIRVSDARITKTKQSARSVKLAIKPGKTGKTTGYILYRRSAGGKWKKLTVIRKAGKQVYTDSGVAYNKSYSYRVRSYYKHKGKTYKGRMSEAVTVKVDLQVAAPSIRSIRLEKNDTRIVIVHGPGKITGYCVYRSTQKGSQTKIADLPAQGQVVFKDTKKSETESYYYQITSYYKEDGKTYSGGATAPTMVKAEISSSTKKITDKNSPLYGKTLFLYRHSDGSAVADQTKYTGSSFSGYELYVNKKEQYVSVYGIKGKYLVPVTSFICSPGNATPVGTHRILLKYRWHELMGPCWGQWCSKVASNGIYFHSIFSSRKNSNSTMSVNAYNKLGTTCSHGCIRLQAGSAKWIYDHCKVGTKVIIHTKTGYEPLGKPSIGKLPSWHTWDPTDPTASKYCKEHKCH